MVSRLRYEVVDVFTTSRYAGNPLAIVELTEDIKHDDKLRIAKEFNLSETVFLHSYSGSNTETKVDIYTPEAELPFAGHPTIGAGYHVMMQRQIDETTLHAKAGPLHLSRSGDIVSASIPHDVHYHHASHLSGVLVSIVKGMTFLLVELDSMEALASQTREIKVELSALDSGWDIGFVGTYYYIRQDASRIQSRMFSSFDSSGVEDPATGSAACTLAAYLSNNSRGESEEFIIMQGVEMGRPSEIHAHVIRKKDAIETITLGGQVVRVMNGSLAL